MEEREREGGAVPLSEVTRGRGLVAELVEGGPGAGKTWALAHRVAALLDEGRAPSDALLVVASRGQVEPARAALRTVCGEAAAGIEVVTVAELALHVLDGSGVRGCATGAPCLLSEAERPFLAEDLKTLGILPRRLREMLKFLEKGLADLSDRDEGWLIMAEEELVLRTLRDQLTIRHATLPCEVANLACQFLESPQGAARLAELRVPCVLADGWTSYNRASQRLVALLAGQRLIAAGYEGDPGVAAIPYSNGCGLEEVRAAFGPQLASDVTLDRATSERESITWEFPDDEFRGLAERAAAELAQGRAASDVVVVAPTRSWGRRAARALEGRGVPVDEMLGAPHGDPREDGPAGGARCLALLGLVVDGRSVVAWRTLLGLGDWLLASADWKALTAWARERGCDPADAVIAVADGADEAPSLPPAGAERVVRAVREARATVQAASGLTGERLLAVVEPDECVRHALLHLIGPLQGDEPADRLLGMLRAALLDPTFSGRPAVRVGLEGAFVGLHPELALLGGLIDGFTPGPGCFDDRVGPDKKERRLAAGRPAFARMLGIASRRTVTSRFTCEWLEEAEPAGMQIERIRAARGGRLASIRPSAYLREMETGEGTGDDVHHE